MAKIARRSVASNPSSLTSSHSIITNSNQIQQHNKRSTSTATTGVATTTLPLISTQSLSANEQSINSLYYQNGSHSNANNNTVQYQNGSTAFHNKQKPSNVGTNNRLLAASNSTLSATKGANNSTTATTNIHRTTAINQFNDTMPIDLVAAERERMRTEFYATYDVMTGVRIAATLGGFFGLMVFLIVYKSRSHSNETLKVLKDPKTAALAVACMQEEEDRKIIEAMDATGLSIFPDEYDTMLFRRQRMLSLGNVSAPPVLNRGFRFSSVGGGGYSSLLEPPRRSSYSYGGPGSRRKSASESSRILNNYPMGSSFGTDDYFVETDDELETDYNQLNEPDDAILQNQGYLEVPPTGQDTRRSSAMTCCSTESSYLERRCSAFTLGLNNLPPSLRQKIEQSDGHQRSRHDSTCDWDYYYPDIQVIQATPKTSPCPSERSLYDKPKYTTTRTLSQDTTTTAGSGISSITVDSNDGGSSNYYRKNSTSAYYDPESVQEKRLQSIDDNYLEEGISYNPQYDLSNETDQKEKQWRNGGNFGGGGGGSSGSNKYADNNELKLMVKRKMSDASSCGTTNNTNMNNNSLSYILNNNNSSLTEAQAAALAVIDGAVVSHMQRAISGICGTGVGRAPLASCSSFKMSSIDYQDSELRSMGEDDSIFIESYADTDDDLEQFSTDSDEISLDIEDEEYDKSRFNTHRKNDLEKNKLPLPIIGSSNSSTAPQNSIKSEPIHTTTTTTTKVIDRENDIKNHFNRPSLERHRTLSVSSSDKIQLVPSISSNRFLRNKSSILETHFTTPSISIPIVQQELLLKPNLAGSPLILRRAQLQQQSSDPHSLPTTTDEATTTTFDTCSTEVPVVLTSDDDYSGAVGGGDNNGGNISTTTTTTTTVVGGVVRKQPPTIKTKSSFSYDNNNDSSISSNSNNKFNINYDSHLRHYRSHYSEGSAGVSTRHNITSGRNELPSNSGGNGIGKTVGNLSSSYTSPYRNKNTFNFIVDNNKTKNNNKKIKTTIKQPTKGPSVILELPVIQLPTGRSDYDDNDDDRSERDDRSRGTCSEGAVRDPSLPGSSRKWSRETLF